MARIDDLLTQITDKGLRQKLEAALTDMKRRQRFGLVFEEHVPETSALINFPINVGATVQRRSEIEGKALYQVSAVTTRGKVTIQPEGGGELETAAAKDLMVVKRFGERTRLPLIRVAVVCCDPDQFRSRGYFAVDVHGKLGMVRISIS